MYRNDDMLNNVNGEWTLRKASGCCLEQLSVCFRDSLLNSAIPAIEVFSMRIAVHRIDFIEGVRMVHRGERSSLFGSHCGGMSVLHGRTSQGDFPVYNAFSVDVLRFLLNVLVNPSNSAIFSTVSWCLGRYAAFAFSQGESTYLPSIVDCLLKAMVFYNAKV